MAHDERDQVDVIMGQWREQNPLLDTPARALSIRLRRVAHHIEREVRRELAADGIELWEFEVLLALRRAPKHQLKAGALLRQSQVTSGAITNRIGRLEAQGWVEREVCPDDRRQVIVRLTRAGLKRSQKILDTKTITEDRLFGGLDEATVTRLSDDLRTLLVNLEGPGDEDPEPGSPACFPPEPIKAERSRK